MLPARLEANGVPILTGKARLDSGELTAMNHGFKANNYKVALIGNNADWFADVGNILVRSLGWQDITVSTATVKTNYNPLTSEHCFILMKWKAWENETYIVENGKYVNVTIANGEINTDNNRTTDIGVTFEIIYQNTPVAQL